MISRAALTCLVLWPVAAHSQPSESWVTAADQHEISDTLGLRAYLVTVDGADEIESRFGHSSIWIRRGESVEGDVYTFGRSNALEPRWLLGVVLGQVVAGAAIWDAASMLDHYARLDRTIWLQELNLTSQQIHEMDRLLTAEVLQDNGLFTYDFYRRNCTTILRDVLNVILADQLRVATVQPSGHTFRSLTLASVGDESLWYPILQTILGQSVDQPITRWDALFLPSTLRSAIRDLSVIDPTGKIGPLVAAETRWYVSSRPGDVQWPMSRPWLTALTFGMLALLTLLGTARLASSSKVAAAMLSALTVGVSVLIGAGGSLLATIWGSTEQHLVYRNENLLLLNPIMLAVAYLALGSPTELRWAYRLSAGAVGIALVGLVLKPLPWLFQSNWSVVALVLPILVGLACSLWTQSPLQSPMLAEGHTVTAEPASLSV